MPDAIAAVGYQLRDDEPARPRVNRHRVTNPKSSGAIADVGGAPAKNATPAVELAGH